MIKIFKRENNIVLQYTPDYVQENWIKEAFSESKSIYLAKNSFKFSKENLLETIENENIGIEYYLFLLGTLKDKYYEINKDTLGIDNPLFLYEQLKIDKKTFLAANNISIFKKIDELVSEPIIIGGDKNNAIPLDEFETLQKLFPTSTTLYYFAQSRVSRIIKDYLHTTTDSELKLENHLKKQMQRANSIKDKNKPLVKVKIFRTCELEKYKYIKYSIKNMLENPEAYSEYEWRNIIIEFILLLFPKYIAVIKEMIVRDYYSEPTKEKYRKIDLALVDTNGNIDIIEIKKPFTDVLLYKRKYRDNYTPKKDLSGTIMQVEKYIFHLNKWGTVGEKKLNKKYRSKLPKEIELKIINPKAIIIMGRDNDFTNDQSFDLSIIKKQNTNIMDIITYDDLLNRLSCIIRKFETKIGD